MKLQPVPGAPGYYIDCENLVPYTRKSGLLKPMGVFGKQAKLMLSIDGKIYGATIYRMAYCALNGIDITRIPKETCITMRRGELVVVDRAEVVRWAQETRRTHRATMAVAEHEMELQRKYFDGDVQPFLEYFNEVSNAVKKYIAATYSMSEERAEICVCAASDTILEMMQDGKPCFGLFNLLRRYALGQRKKMRKTIQYKDWMQPIEI